MKTKEQRMLKAAEKHVEMAKQFERKAKWHRYMAYAALTGTLDLKQTKEINDQATK